MKKTGALFIALSLSLTLSGCKKTNDNFEIKFNTIVPTAYVDEEYDFSDVLIIDDAVNYHLDVYYFDYYSKTEKTLTVRKNYYFTPLEAFDLSVVITASKGGTTKTKTKTINVSQRLDPIDELLNGGGFSGWADAGFTKEAVTDSQYLKGENSHSGLAVHFAGSNPYRWGGSFLCMNNFRLLPYWDDQSWENAVIHFWVYNPTDYPLEFQLRIFDELTNKVNVDWDMPLNVSQYAVPNDWSEIMFSLRHMGVDHTLYQNEEGTRNDSVTVKVRWGGTPDGQDELYSYQFYVDDINITPFSEERFPGLDTKCYATAETIENGWENMVYDGGMLTSNPLFDREFVNSTEENESLSSMFLTFKDRKSDDNNGYAIFFSPQQEFGDDNMPSFRHGTIDFDVHFDGVDNKELQIIGINLENDDWNVVARLNVVPSETENEWSHVSIDLGRHNEFFNVTNCARFGIRFMGIDDDNKENAVIHLDNITFKQNEGTNPTSAETLDYGWENMALDSGWMASTASYDCGFVNSSEGHQSLSSLIVDFKGKIAKDSNGFSVILSPEEEFLSNPELLPSFRHGTLDFDVHFSNDVENKELQVFAVQETTWSVARYNINPVESSNEWMHVSIDFGQHNEFYGINKGIRLGISFLGVDDLNKENAIIHLDNIVFNQNAGTPESEIVRGESFVAGTNYIGEIVDTALSSTLVIDIKITSGEETYLNLCLLDSSWTNYLGYFEINYDGSLSETYDGVSVVELSDGYYRLTLNLSQITQKTGSPSAISIVFIRGDWTTASGYIDINPNY